MMLYLQQVGPYVFKTEIDESRETHHQIQTAVTELKARVNTAVKQANAEVVADTAKRVSEIMRAAVNQSDTGLNDQLIELRALAKSWQNTANRNDKAAITRKMTVIARSVEDLIRANNNPKMHLDYSKSDAELARDADIAENQRYFTQLYRFADMALAEDQQYHFSDCEPFYFQGSIASYLLDKHGSIESHYHTIIDFANMLCSRLPFQLWDEYSWMHDTFTDVLEIPNLVRNATDAVDHGYGSDLINCIENSEIWVHQPGVKLSYTPIA